MSDERTIVVTGATGRQGGATARHLLASGMSVRIFVRDPDKPAARQLAAAGAEVVVGDMLDPDTLLRAFEGAYGVYSVQPWRGPGGVVAEQEMGFNVADEAAAAGIEHIVYSSVGGADRAPGIAHFESKHNIEHRIDSLGIPATVLRPVSFMDNFQWQVEGIRAGKLVQGVKPTTRLQMIDSDDIGAFAAMAFADPDEWVGRTIEIAGDEMTMVEVAAVFSERLGRTVTYTPAAENRPGAGVGERRMTAWFDEHGYDADIAALRAIYPPLKDLRTYLAKATWLVE